MHPYGPYRISCLWGCGNPRVALPVPCRCRNPPQTDETDRRSGSSSWFGFYANAPQLMGLIICMID